MVAVWCFSEWQKMGSPIPLQLVEMGPGHGSLAVDILRVILTFLIVMPKYVVVAVFQCHQMSLMDFVVSLPVVAKL
jgi:SAM-dependent MidA family methyltransferase